MRKYRHFARYNNPSQVKGRRPTRSNKSDRGPDRPTRMKEGPGGRGRQNNKRGFGEMEIEAGAHDDRNHERERERTWLQ